MASTFLHAHGDTREPPLAATGSGSSFMSEFARFYPQSRCKRHVRPSVENHSFSRPSRVPARAQTLGSLDIPAENDDTTHRSTHTWTTSDEDVELQANCDVVDDRGVFVDEYNRLSKKYGIRPIITGDFPTARSDHQTSQAKGTWLSRGLKSTRNINSATVTTFSSPADQRMQRHRSVGDFVVDFVAPTKKGGNHGNEDIISLMRLCGKSMLFLPSDFATRPLALPTCLRATAQALVQQAGTRGLFRIPGSVRIVNALYNYYHDNPDVEQLSSTTRCPNLPSHINLGVHDVASVFKKFLGSLPGGILGSLGVFDALVGIFSRLHADPELAKTKQTRLRARLIALALNTVASSYQRDMICAVFGLLSFVGRQAETTLHEDEKGRPLPTADLMGYTALGIIFGPLLVGELLAGYSMRVADPMAGLVLFAVTPARSRKRDHQQKRSKSTGPGNRLPPTVDKFHVANGIVEMVITHWREVIRQWRCLDVQRMEAQLGEMQQETNESLYGTTAVGQRASLQHHELRRGSNVSAEGPDLFTHDRPLSIWNQSLPNFKFQSADDPASDTVAYHNGNENQTPRRVSKPRLSSGVLLTPNPSAWASGRILSPPLEVSTGVSPSSTNPDVTASRHSNNPGQVLISHTSDNDVKYSEPSIYIQRPSQPDSVCPTPGKTADSNDDYMLASAEAREIQGHADMRDNCNDVRAMPDSDTTETTDNTTAVGRLSNHVELPTGWTNAQPSAINIPETSGDLYYSSGLVEPPGKDTEREHLGPVRLGDLSLKTRNTIPGENLTQDSEGSIGNDTWHFVASKNIKGIEQSSKPPAMVESVDISPDDNARSALAQPRVSNASEDITTSQATKAPIGRLHPHSRGNSTTSMVSRSHILQQYTGTGKRLSSEAETRPDTPPWKRLLLHRRNEQRRKPSSISRERRDIFENEPGSTCPRGGNAANQSKTSMHPSRSDDSMRTTSTWQPMAASLTGGVRAMTALFDQRSRTPRYAPSKQPCEEMSPMAKGSSVYEPSQEAWKDASVRLGSLLQLDESSHVNQNISSDQRSFNVIQLSTPRRDHLEASSSRPAADQADSPTTPNNFPRVKLKPTGIRLDVTRSVPRNLTDQLMLPRSRFLSRTPSLGRMRGLEDTEPPVAQHLNYARPSSRLEDSSANGGAGGGSTRPPVESRHMASSSSLLHDRIHSLQNQLAAREEEITQLRRLLDTRGHIDIGTLSQELRQTKRECKTWRERAETAEKRVAAFERITAKMRQRQNGNITSASMEAASLDQSDGVVSSIKDNVRSHDHRDLGSSDRSDHTEDLDVFRDRIRVQMMGGAELSESAGSCADGEVFG